MVWKLSKLQPSKITDKILKSSFFAQDFKILIRFQDFNQDFRILIRFQDFKRDFIKFHADSFTIFTFLLKKIFLLAYCSYALANYEQ